MFSPISVVIPAYTEADVINEAIRRLRTMPGGRDCEIVVVDGHPQGTTLAVIDDPGVLKICCEKGRGRQMNAGAKAASGAILLFLHADSRLPVDALSRISKVMKEGRCIGGAFALRIDGDKVFLRLIGWLTTLRARLTRVPYGDQGIFIRRDYFNAVEGYREIPILEDVELMKRIRRRKGRIILLPETVLTSSRRWDRKGCLSCTLRNRMIMALYNLGIGPERLARFYA